MAQNVCRYNKFGHCKYSEKCKFLHISEKCQNNSCEIKSCKLRHPRVCNYFRDYKRCKFGEWCSFEHVDTEMKDREIVEKIVNLEKLIEENDKIISDMDNRIKILEERMNGTHEEAEEESVLDCTFFNPYNPLSFQCAECDFIAKSNTGLKVHIKAKHGESENFENQSYFDVLTFIQDTNQIFTRNWCTTSSCYNKN